MHGVCGDALLSRVAAADFDKALALLRITSVFLTECAIMDQRECCVGSAVSLNLAHTPGNIVPRPDDIRHAEKGDAV